MRLFNRKKRTFWYVFPFPGWMPHLRGLFLPLYPWFFSDTFKNGQWLFHVHWVKDPHEASWKKEPLYPLLPLQYPLQSLPLVLQAFLVSYGRDLSLHPKDTQDGFIGKRSISSCAGWFLKVNAPFWNPQSKLCEVQVLHMYDVELIWWWPCSVSVNFTKHDFNRG